MTANLQVPAFSVRTAAKLMNVSERTVFMARELVASGRQDLVVQVEAGTLSVHAALKRAYPAKYDRRRDGLKALRRAWALATIPEQAAFLEEVRL